MRKSNTGLLLIFTLFLGACSSSFLYNQLDWLIPWWLDGYVDLSREQKRDLKARLKPLLQWHREEELRRYLELIQGISADLEAAIEPDDIRRWGDEMWRAYQRLEKESLPMMFAVGESFSDAQMQEFMDRLYRDQKKLEKKYLRRSEEEFREEVYDDFADNMSDFLGRLQPEQKQRLKQASQEMERFDDAWLQQRRDWLDTLAGILLNRDPDWQEQVQSALELRENNRSEAYNSGYENNQRIIFQVVADLLNSRTPKQTARLEREINSIRRDLENLLADSRNGGGGITPVG